MAETQRRYRAFLLRLWQERNEGKWIWRASLEDAHSHVRMGFPNLARLLAFLKEETEDKSTEQPCSLLIDAATRFSR